jgi:hypothetical protein
LLLAQLESSDVARDKWIDNALSILTNATNLAWKPQWQSLLSNGTVNRPANSFSTGIVYGSSFSRAHTSWKRVFDVISVP